MKLHHFYSSQNEIGGGPVLETSFTNFLSKFQLLLIKIRHAQHTARGSNLAHEAQNLVYLAYFFHKDILKYKKNHISFGHRTFGPPKIIELCNPDLNVGYRV